MPYDPETGEWIEDEDEPGHLVEPGQPRQFSPPEMPVERTDYGNEQWSYTGAEYDGDQPRQYAPPQQIPQQQGGGWNAFKSGYPDVGYDQPSGGSQQRIFNMVGGEGPSGEGGQMVEDTRPAVARDDWQPFYPGSASGTVRGDPNAPLLQSAYARRRQEFPSESAQQSVEQVGNDYASAIQNQRANQNPQLRREEQQLSPEEQLAATENQIAAVTPSHADNMYMQRLQNGKASVEMAVANGSITQEMGQMLSGQIVQRMQPQMVNAQQLRLLAARAQYQRMELDNARQTALLGASRAALARGGPAMSPDGQFYQTGPDRWAASPRTENARHAVTEANSTIRLAVGAQHNWDAELRAAQVAVNHEITAYNRDPEKAPDWYVPNNTTARVSNGVQRTTTNTIEIQGRAEAERRVLDNPRFGPRPAVPTMNDLLRGGGNSGGGQGAPPPGGNAPGGGGNNQGDDRQPGSVRNVQAINAILAAVSGRGVNPAAPAQAPAAAPPPAQAPRGTLSGQDRHRLDFIGGL